MDADAVLAVFDRQMRREAAGERAGGVVRRIGGDGDWSGVLWSDLDEETADRAIAEQVRHFAVLGRGFEWKVYGHDRPRDLGARLRAAGFTAEPQETLMVARTGDLPTAVEPPEGVRLHAVADEAGVELVVEVHEQAFGTGGARPRRQLLAQLAGAPGTFGMTVAMAGDRPVCAARMELYPGTEFAGLWGGGTVPGWRGRGVYRALVAHRARLAAARGFRYLQVDASDQSRPILHRLGFTPLGTTTPYVYEP